MRSGAKRKQEDNVADLEGKQQSPLLTAPTTALSDSAAAASPPPEQQQSVIHLTLGVTSLASLFGCFGTRAQLREFHTVWSRAKDANNHPIARRHVLRGADTEPLSDLRAALGVSEKAWWSFLNQSADLAFTQEAVHAVEQGALEMFFRQNAALTDLANRCGPLPHDLQEAVDSIMTRPLTVAHHVNACHAWARHFLGQALAPLALRLESARCAGGGDEAAETDASTAADEPEDLAVATAASDTSLNNNNNNKPTRSGALRRGAGGGGGGGGGSVPERETQEFEHNARRAVANLHHPFWRFLVLAHAGERCVAIARARARQAYGKHGEASYIARQNAPGSKRVKLSSCQKEVSCTLEFVASAPRAGPTVLVHIKGYLDGMLEGIGGGVGPCLVEIKHRASEIPVSIPVYEFIQIQTYMRMTSVHKTKFVQREVTEQGSDAEAEVVSFAPEFWQHVVLPRIARFAELAREVLATPEPTAQSAFDFLPPECQSKFLAARMGAPPDQESMN